MFFYFIRDSFFCLGHEEAGIFSGAVDFVWSSFIFFSCFLFSVPFPNLIALFFCLFFFTFSVAF